ncbi:MAG: aspartate ammonia-lyase, partial [Aurantimicrobium sp.]
MSSTDRVGNFAGNAQLPIAPAATRTETDSLGAMQVPADAYWGVHTARALENFPIAKRP